MILNASREAVYTALFAVLQTIPGMVTCTRKLKHWQNVESSEQPALYMEHHGEQKVPVDGKPPRIVLEVNLWLYVTTNEGETGPVMNPLLDAIEKVFEPKDANGGDRKFTLGGKAHHCWIEGQTQIFEGNLGNEAVAIIPVKLLVT